MGEDDQYLDDLRNYIALAEKQLDEANESARALRVRFMLGEPEVGGAMYDAESYADDRAALLVDLRKALRRAEGWQRAELEKVTT